MLRLLLRRTLPLVLLALASGCGPGFDPASEVKTLRVLAVEKEEPYPVAGSSVMLRMLWDDPKQRDSIELAWSPPCVNPPSDTYYSCFSSFTGTWAAPRNPNQDSTFSIDIPADVIDTHAPPTENNPRYGLVYAFFALCAGHIEPDFPPLEVGALPLKCVDTSGNRLGPNDFVVGYSSLYVFDTDAANRQIPNLNPIVSGLQLGATTLTPTDNPGAVCIGGECVPKGPLALETTFDCAGADAARCFPACADDGGSGCPSIELKAVVDRKSAEKDGVSAKYYNRDLEEQLWVNFYSDRGSVDSQARLLNDAQRGWNDDSGTKFRAPKEPGPVNVWAVVHDNRGGVSWARSVLNITP